jgi:hypothetical protein
VQRTSSELPAELLLLSFGFLHVRDLLRVCRVAWEWRRAAKHAKPQTTWLKLSPREFLAAVSYLAADQVERLDLDLDPWTTTTSGTIVTDYLLLAREEEVAAGLRSCVALKYLEVRHGNVSRNSFFVWRNVELAALESLTLTNVSLVRGSFKDLPRLRTLHLHSCKSGGLVLPSSLDELTVVNDQELELRDLVRECGKVVHLSLATSRLRGKLRIDHCTSLLVCRQSQRLQQLTVRSCWLEPEALLDLARECKVACPSLQRVCLAAERKGQIANQILLKD